MLSIASSSEAVVLLTEWSKFRTLDLTHGRQLLDDPPVGLRFRSLSGVRSGMKFAVVNYCRDLYWVSQKMVVKP